VTGAQQPFRGARYPGAPCHVAFVYALCFLSAVCFECFCVLRQRTTTTTIIINLSTREARTCARPLFCRRDLDINPMTLKLEGDLDILKVYFYAENEVAGLRHSKLLIMDEICMANKKYENSCQGQRSRSNVTNFQPLLAFTMGHMPTIYVTSISDQ